MKSLIVILVLALTVGCASSPENIQGYYVSSKKFEHYTCDDIAIESEAVTTKVYSLYGDTKRASQKDAAWVAASIVVFWPAAFFVGNNGMDEAQYALLKGEMEALERASRIKECDITFLKS